MRSDSCPMRSDKVQVLSDNFQSLLTLKFYEFALFP
jgi:hypothetical protein